MTATIVAYDFNAMASIQRRTARTIVECNDIPYDLIHEIIRWDWQRYVEHNPDNTCSLGIYTDLVLDSVVEMREG